MENNSNDKLAEALKLLEEAAREKKEDLRTLISDKYSHLKSVLVETEHTVIDGLSDTLKREIERTIKAKNKGKRKVKEAAVAVNGQVHSNPWPYIGGVAVIALLGGYLMGHKSSSSGNQEDR